MRSLTVWSLVIVKLINVKGIMMRITWLLPLSDTCTYVRTSSEDENLFMIITIIIAVSITMTIIITMYVYVA
eukprot:7611199-Karenia_brevis.AAC.1